MLEVTYAETIAGHGAMDVARSDRVPDDAALAFLANCEACVPAGWQHPGDARGSCVPLLPSGYVSDDAEHADLMPEPTGATEIATYETVSEGTPISPAFPARPRGIAI